jgi:perosamine synthetase
LVAYAAIAARHEIPLIEDSCEAMGTTAKGKKAGSFGRVGVFGFYPNKQITTGEGGMIVTDDERLAELCRSMRNQGRPMPQLSGSHTKTMEPSVGGTAAGSWLRHERLGYNYRLSEINAAIGVGQMRRFDDILGKRTKVAEAYIQRLGAHPHLTMPTIEHETFMSWFVFVVRLAPTYTIVERERIIRGLRAHDIGASDYFPCIHLQPFYQEQFGYRTGMHPIAESMSQRTIALPFYNDLTMDDIEVVAQTLEVLIERENLVRS